MIRTQIYLGEYEYKMFKEKSHRENTSLSEAIRELLRLGQEKEKEQLTERAQKRPNAIQSLLQSIRRIERQGYRGPRDTSTTGDAVLYGRQ